MDEIEFVSGQGRSGQVEASDIEVVRLDLFEETGVEVDGQNPSATTDL